MKGAIPTLVVVVDCGLTVKTLDNLSRFAVSADVVPIVCFAYAHYISIGYIFLIATIHPLLRFFLDVLI